MNKQIGRLHADRQTDGQKDVKKDGQIDGKSKEQTNRQTYRRTDRQMDRKTESQMNRKIGRHTGGQASFFFFPYNDSKESINCLIMNSNKFENTFYYVKYAS